MAKLSREDLREQCRRQIRFIQNSVAAIASGNLEEAIRLATTIRVLIHEPKQKRRGKQASQSLLGQLGAMGVHLFTTSRDQPSSVLYYAGPVMHKIDGSGAEFATDVNVYRFGHFVPATKWWNQVVFIRDGVRLTRRDVVLTAANKDGGAHVDAELTAEYEMLKAPGAMGFVSVGSQTSGKVFTIDDGHLKLIGLMGIELLKSPDLLNVAGL